MRLAWDARLALFAAVPLLHVVLTVPPALRPLVSDIRAFRVTGRKVVEAWFRASFKVAPRERLFMLDVLHPAGDERPDEWAPHLNVFLLASVLGVNGHLRATPASARKAALDDLRARWARALGDLVGQPVPGIVVRLEAQHRYAARRAVIWNELRSFPGWLAGGISKLGWSGAFGPRVWNRVRAGLALTEPQRGCDRCRAPLALDKVCDAPLVPFATLPSDGRALVRSAEERDGNARIQPWERTFDDHSRTRAGCSCADCKRAQSVGTPAHRALAATRAAADYAREIATDPRHTRVTDAGGALHDDVRELRRAYEALDALPRHALTVDEAKAPRDVFLAFIAKADAAGLTTDPSQPWRKRYAALFEERQSKNHSFEAVTGKWRLTVNVAWVKAHEPASPTAPCDAGW